MFQSFFARAASFFHQQAAQFFNREFFRRFASCHGEADYTAGIVIFWHTRYNGNPSGG
jgi:hypothetical protein